MNNFLSTPTQRSATTELILYLLVVMLMGLFGTLVSALVSQAIGITELKESLNALATNNTFAARSSIRILLMINHIFLFILPSLLFVWWIHKSEKWRFLELRLPRQSSHWITVIFLIIVSFPFAQFVYWVNKQIALPSLARNMEESAGQLTEALMTMESPADLVFNLLVIAFIPAIGEELVFRGVIQTYLKKISNNAHIGVWIAALLFSMMHLQFEGFLPRLLLGAILGYSFLWSRSLWIPIVAHFVFNGTQIIGKYVYSGNQEGIDPEQISQMPWYITVGSLFFMILLGFNMWTSRVKS